MENEKNLVKALKKGDRKAFKELFLNYYNQVYAFCYSFLHQKEDAENITQDVFVQLWAKRESLDPSKSLSGFLFTIAHNKTLNHIRSEINRQMMVKEIVRKKKEESNPTETKVSFNELKQLIEKGIRQLPPKRREIFLLSRNEGLSHIEISKQLNISVHTVESQMTKALRFMRESLKNHRI
jgi:RNA polymerase sigma-70 factor (ECF subfamily)